jgi:hypothetical protein
VLRRLMEVGTWGKSIPVSALAPYLAGPVTLQDWDAATLKISHDAMQAA